MGDALNRINLELSVKNEMLWRENQSFREQLIDMYNLLMLAVPPSAVKDSTMARVRNTLRRLDVEVD